MEATTPARVAFRIKAGAIYADHPEFGWCRIVVCGCNGDAAAFVREHYRDVEWDENVIQRSGTFVRFDA